MNTDVTNSPYPLNSKARRKQFVPSEVSIVIPTFNSARTLERCLISVDKLDPAPGEVIVVDSLSTDGTAEIAERYAKLISLDCGLPAARLIGAKAAHERFILYLDSDQIIEPTALRRASDDGHGVLAFGESSVGPGLVAFLNDVDRRRLHRHWERQLDPVFGTIRPRFYPRETLVEALEQILRPLVARQHIQMYSEDSLIYVASGVTPDSIGFIPNAIDHLEMTSVWEYVKKWGAYGRYARLYRGTSLEKFARRRATRKGSVGDRIAGFPALLLRAVPFAFGYYF